MMAVRVIYEPGGVILERTTEHPGTGRGPYTYMWRLDEDEWQAIVQAARKPEPAQSRRRRWLW